LIVLDSKGIDVILGMDWRSKQKALIDCANKLVNLTTDAGQELEYIAELLITHKGSTNHIKLNQMEANQSQDISIVNEYLDVLPGQLPGMPPNRDIEFLIELLPNTAPIYKKPYRMSSKQLGELKEQIQELEGKGYEGPRRRPEGEGGVNGSLIKFFHKNLMYVPHSKCQAKNP
jgi:hypothetical protein